MMFPLSILTTLLKMWNINWKNLIKRSIYVDKKSEMIVIQNIPKTLPSKSMYPGRIDIVNPRSWKIVVCFNRYNGIVSSLQVFENTFVLTSLSSNNSDLLKFYYVIVSLFNNTSVLVVVDQFVMLEVIPTSKI